MILLKQGDVHLLHMGRPFLREKYWSALHSSHLHVDGSFRI